MRNWRPKVKTVFRLGERVLAAVGALFLLYSAFFDLSVITSGSMAPALQGSSKDEGDWVLAEAEQERPSRLLPFWTMPQRKERSLRRRVLCSGR